MAKIGKPIPGRVYSASADGIVTGADSIHDDDLNMPQSQINKLLIDGETTLAAKTLFTVGDSLCAGGNWQSVVAAIAKCSFDQAKNSMPGFQISSSGTISYGGKKDCGLVRITNIAKQGCSPDIILLQNVNDFNAFAADGTPLSGTIDDDPLIINQIIEGNSLADWESDAAAVLSSIPADERMLGTSLELLYDADGKNLQITNTATAEGDIVIKVSTPWAALSYSIHVLPTDAISDIVDKILEYNYTYVTDTKASSDSVDFSTGVADRPCSIEFNGGSTGVTAVVTDTSTAKASEYKIFTGENLTTDWIDPENWNGEATFYASWKGMIEYAKVHWPQATVVLLLFPCFIINETDPQISPRYTVNADGTFDQELYNTENERHLRQMATYDAQKEIANIYNIPIIDVHSKCGITIGNYLHYYPNNNVHPNNAGYEYFGRLIAKELLSIL